VNDQTARVWADRYCVPRLPDEPYASSAFTKASGVAGLIIFSRAVVFVEAIVGLASRVGIVRAIV